MTWKHLPETKELHDTWDADKARVYKDGDGRWRAMVWPESPAHGKHLGKFATAAQAKRACEEKLK